MLALVLYRPETGAARNTSRGVGGSERQFFFLARLGSLTLRRVRIPQWEWEEASRKLKSDCCSIMLYRELSTSAIHALQRGRGSRWRSAEWLPHLILCDVMMPLMDGPATLARLREITRTAKIPVIFMTARVQARELEHFTSLGASRVIAKPLSARSLRESVRSFAGC
jgi:CheY-like chemotaxis protein